MISSSYEANRQPLLESAFFDRNPIAVAKGLLGQRLVREYQGERLSGMITETESYLASEDSASHAFRGKTLRNSIMFGPPAVAYIYFIYGLHFMLNVVTEAVDVPSAVLIRGIEPLEGIETMTRLRNGNGENLTNGPARLCQAMAIDRTLNGWSLTKGEQLWIESYRDASQTESRRGPRIGIDYARERDRNRPLRFWLARPR